MSGIFGIFNRSGQPVSPETIQTMYDAMAYWGPDGGNTWRDGCAGLGQLLLYNTPEALYEKLPRWLPQHKLAFTAEARIDNRAELCRLFNIPAAERPTTPDSDLILRAYLKWGEACPDHLLGDWSFAVWQPAERRLFLARDHHGNTALYYYADRDFFAFASSRKALLALGVPRRLNELYLAQMLSAWPAYHGERTIDLDIYRVPPAHSLTVTPQKLAARRYWYLEDTPMLHYKRHEDYVIGLRELFSEAVRCRLRSYRPVAATLSGGLDSGSVTALAARELACDGKRLPAFCAAPLYDTRPFVPEETRFGDESEFAAATARHAGNVDLHLLRSESVGPLDGLVASLWVHDEPQFGAGNAFWVLDMLRQVKKAGVGVLLTGQGGNASVSWTGSEQSLPWPARVQRLGLRRALKQLVATWLPAAAKAILLDRRLGRRPWHNRAALQPQFAARIGLRGAIRAEADYPWAVASITPRDQRCRLIFPGRGLGGVWWAESQAAAGIEVRDPTEDVRLLRFCLAVPDRCYWGPTPDDDRWLIRSAMAGLLPEAVRLNRRRGRQAGDLVIRLRQQAGAMDTLLAKLAGGPATQYLDIDRMKALWQQVQRDDSPAAHRSAAVILLRGLMAGLFLDPRPLAAEAGIALSSFFNRPDPFVWPLYSTGVSPNNL